MRNNSTNLVRFSIAESDYYFKQFLIKMLLENPFYSIVNDCNNGNELINRLYRKQEDIFILNLFMPILSGIEAIKFIRETNNTVPILTYSDTYQEDMANLIADIPNVFYCQKNSIIIKDLLRNCILSENSNYEDYKKEWASQSQSVQDYMERQKREQQDISVTEIQIIKLSYEGYSNKEIGDRINLSARTIDTYITRLTEKLGLKSKLDLVRFCVEKGYYNSSI
ncbi:response regulator transcription factor [Kaistella jeonii]|uniref:Transcriptional regulator n=2 Tax=Kaistella jeonii TaxID=266749 RepID=A0A0C1CVY4_9FLAO|nr:response regulator transcription factor [Kaistella jeonii]KIA85480.1 transcriptional regulator [Kaistella jeonii]SFC41983.1 DNA-binding response regulator, NarL/FixJ family, contains REC and HTH domains [Kaistella jeonii]VEI97342.1 Transcriptional regulatory protein devR (dosR) [Kaistella jeonii]